MSIEEIRTLRNAKPFTPFDIVMDDGRAVPVAHPLEIAISPTGTYVAVPVRKSFDILHLRHMREVKVHAESNS